MNDPGDRPVPEGLKRFLGVLQAEQPGHDLKRVRTGSVDLIARAFEAWDPGLNESQSARPEEGSRT